MNNIFKDEKVKAIVFQSENDADDRKGKKRHRYTMIAYKKIDTTYTPIEQELLFEEDIDGLEPVGISMDKRGLTTGFANYYLRRNYISETQSPDKSLLLFFPRLLGTTDLDSRYIKYDIIPANEAEIPDLIKSLKQTYNYLSNKPASTQQSTTGAPRAQRMMIQFEMNPSPPRNAEEN